ncbi:MAG: aminotransferase class V-fold PLP-dependent enzyme [Phycisphaerales bacterium]|nr:aminotransferase class V-fold PLP-dependent enzyme [Phycisphaerales bacterium]
MPHSRRDFLAAAPGAASLAVLAGPALARHATLEPRATDIARELKADKRGPADIADDDAFWSQVARAFTIDRSVINLNNGGVSPSPGFVQEAMKRHLDFSNTAPPPYALWQVLEPQKEGTRRALAQQFGADAEELAITRNASESLQILQQGLDLSAGDAVLTTTADYPRMLTTFEQRQRREGIRLVRFQIPVPASDPAEIVRRFEAHITPRTRLILCSRVVFLTGGALPVREICDLGHRRGIPVLVDAAHSFAHLDERIDDLGCDFLGTSLHKWLFAPHGTGLLYVKRDRIKDVWPLMAAAEKQTDDVRKFEEIGTHPAANHLAIAEALTFHDGIGSSRKFARMVHLRDLWARTLLDHPRHASRVRLQTSLEPGLAGGIATVDFEGLEPRDLQSWLWSTRRIFTVAIGDGAETPEPLRHNVRGLRVSPSVYTTPREIERFVEAIQHALDHGIA